MSAFAESAMAVKRVVMQHFSMNLALEARLTSLDEDSGLGHEPEVEVEMMDAADLEHTIQFGFLSLDSDGASDAAVTGGSSGGSSSGSGADHVMKLTDNSRKKVTFGLTPPSQSRLAQRRLVKTLSLDASVSGH